MISDMQGAVGFEGYLEALQKYEKKLRKLSNKHAKARAKEEQNLQRLINEMASYSRQDAARGTVNNDEKMKKAYDYARECQQNDQMRKNEIEQLHRDHYPKKSDFIQMM